MRSALLAPLGGAVLLAGAALASPGTPTKPIAPTFAAETQGTLRGRLAGRVALGVVGTPGEAGSSYTITLGAAAGAIVLTRLDAAPLRPGRFPIGESPALDSTGGFRALYLAGRASRPAGVFRGVRGTLELLPDAPDRLAGRLEFQATGFTAQDPDDESRQVTVTARFEVPALP